MIYSVVKNRRFYTPRKSCVEENIFDGLFELSCIKTFGVEPENSLKSLTRC